MLLRAARAPRGRYPVSQPNPFSGVAVGGWLPGLVPGRGGALVVVDDAGGSSVGSVSEVVVGGVDDGFGVVGFGLAGVVEDGVDDVVGSGSLPHQWW